MNEREASPADDLDLVWRALANPTRRRILDVLKERALQTGELADRFPDLSRFSVMQHLGVLEEGDLVVRRRVGRATINYFNPVPIQRIHDRWINRMRRPWVESLVDLKQELEGAAEGSGEPAEDDENDEETETEAAAGGAA